MAQTRNSYDNVAYNHKQKELEGGYYWTMYPHANKNCKTCNTSLSVRSNRINTSEDLTQKDFDTRADVESLLSNRNLPLNKAVGGLNLLHNKTLELQKIQLGILPEDCENGFLLQNNTRDVNTVLNRRSIFIPRWEEPIVPAINWVNLNATQLIGNGSRNGMRDSFDKLYKKYKKNNN